MRAGEADQQGHCAGQRARIDQHPDRDEEQARKQVAERADLRVHLVAHLALGKHQPREKRADSHREARE